MRGGEAGQYSSGVSAALTQIVPYSASLYTVFHSVIYNSVCILYICTLYLNSRNFFFLKIKTGNDNELNFARVGVQMTGQFKLEQEKTTAKNVDNKKRS